MSILHQFIQETEAMANAEVATNVVSFREAKVQRIKALAAQWSENAVLLGREIKAVRDTFPVKAGQGAVTEERPEWQAWCKKHLGFSAAHAQKFIRIADKFGGSGTPLPLGSAYLLDFLARETTPESVRQEVVARIERGEEVGYRTAKKIKEQHEAPPPEEARKIAKETGKPTLARDGNIYLGASKAQEKEIEERRRLVSDVRRAVETLSGIDMTPAAFLKQALPHQLWTSEEEHQIGKALDWLTDLATVWEKR